MSPKIIDCFIFYNEIDLLKYRLLSLKDIVYKFIIVESTHTFTGKEKPSHLLLSELQKEHSFLNDLSDKIIVITAKLPYIYPNIDTSRSQQWQNEWYQRNCINDGIHILAKDNEGLKGHNSFIDDNDVIIISDVDEIPDCNTLNNIICGDVNITINSLDMDFYYYNLNTKIKTNWTLAKILTYKHYKECNKTCSQIRELKGLQLINKGGHHLSYFGNEEFIQNKILNFSHQEYNTSEYTSLDKIKYRIINSKDLYGRNSDIITIPINENTYLPNNYNVYLSKFYCLDSENDSLL